MAVYYSRYGDAANSGRLIDTPMDDVVTTFFDHNFTAAGTGNLNSCSVVAIYDARAAIVAHIRPFAPELGLDGDDNMRRMMDLVEDHHKALKQSGYFTGPTRAISLFAQLREEWLSINGYEQFDIDSQRDIVEEKLRSLGISTEDSTQYKRHEYLTPTDWTWPGYGTFLLDVEEREFDDDFPTAYSENLPIFFD